MAKNEALSRQALKCCSRAHITSQLVPLFIIIIIIIIFCHFRLNPMLHVEENTLSAVHSCITQSCTCLCLQLDKYPTLWFTSILPSWYFFFFRISKKFNVLLMFISAFMIFVYYKHTLCFWASLFATNSTWVTRHNSTALIKKKDPLIFWSYCNPKHSQALWSGGRGV